MNRADPARPQPFTAEELEPLSKANRGALSLLVADCEVLDAGLSGMESDSHVDCDALLELIRVAQRALRNGGTLMEQAQANERREGEFGRQLAAAVAARDTAVQSAKTACEVSLSRARRQRDEAKAQSTQLMVDELRELAGGHSALRRALNFVRPPGGSLQLGGLGSLAAGLTILLWITLFTFNTALVVGTLLAGAAQQFTHMMDTRRDAQQLEARERHEERDAEAEQQLRTAEADANAARDAAVAAAEAARQSAESAARQKLTERLQALEPRVTSWCDHLDGLVDRLLHQRCRMMAEQALLLQPAGEKPEQLAERPPGKLRLGWIRFDLPRGLILAAPESRGSAGGDRDAGAAVIPPAAYSVRLDEVPEISRVHVMSTLRHVTKKGLSVVMRMLNTPGQIVASDLTAEAADELVARLRADGATATRIDG
jgi:hypothetical protein